MHTKLYMQLKTVHSNEQKRHKTKRKKKTKREIHRDTKEGRGREYLYARMSKKNLLRYHSDK